MKTIIASAVSLIISSAINAQTETAYHKETSQEKKETRKEEKELKKKTVSYQTRDQFSRDFPNAGNTVFSVSDFFEEATFDLNGIPMRAYYDHDNQLVGTTTQKTYDDIPAAAKKFIQTHYAGYKVDYVLLFDDNEDNETDMILYNTSFEDSDNYFVSIKNNMESIILKVSPAGEVSFFKQL